jgi:NAD(P)-dependent dehydrogenase (short-subunit alcohol dehydrogenase family)
MGSLDGQVAMITGGGTGIGRGIALVFAREGARVVLSGRRAEPLAETLATIREQGGDGLAVTADGSKEADVDRLVKTTLDTYGTVDILVNNGAIGRLGYMHEHSIQDWDDIMRINLRGPFLLSRAVLPTMRERECGHIVMMSSDISLTHKPGVGAYAVAKHALNAMAEIMQQENQDFGIHIEVVCPGFVVTDMSAGLPLDHDKVLLPDDIADLVLWLVSRPPNVKIGRPVLIQPMDDPWKS